MKETITHTPSQDQAKTLTTPLFGNSEPSRVTPPVSRELTASDILQRIDMLIGGTTYLREGVDALARIESAGVWRGMACGRRDWSVSAAPARARAIHVRAVLRETP